MEVEDPDCQVIAQISKRNNVAMTLGKSITITRIQPSTSSAGPDTIRKTRKPRAQKMVTPDLKKLFACRSVTVTPSLSKELQTKKKPEKRNLRSLSALKNISLNSELSIIPINRKKVQKKKQEKENVPETSQKKPRVIQRKPKIAAPNKNAGKLPQAKRGRPPKFPRNDKVKKRKAPNFGQLLQCSSCLRLFKNQAGLKRHSMVHETGSRILHKCPACPGKYPSIQTLMDHEQRCHKDLNTENQKVQVTMNIAGNRKNIVELAIPVVNVKSPIALNALSSLGIQNYIPLSRLNSDSGDCFSLPIIHIVRPGNPDANSLKALEATGVLSLGPLRFL